MLETLVLGPLETNCYILGCDATGEAVVIDPADDADAILARLRAANLTCKWILNTHGHGDHISANAALKAATQAKLAFHPADRLLVERAVALSMTFGFSVDPSPAPDADLQDKQVLRFGKEQLLVLHTPGHSPGSVSFAWSDDLFDGDLLFAGGIGRTDLPGGSFSQLLESIRTRLFPLGDHTHVYPGHGPATTIGTERRVNPYLTDF